MTERTLQILRDLEAVRENLLALSDDIWLGIDHNDSEAMEEGVAFKREYNAKLAAFDGLATEISALVQQFRGIDLAEEEETGGEDEASNERIIRELDREVPHLIDEDFTFKRPHGFILDGQATTGITTWRRLYELLCQQLLRRDRERFHALVGHPELTSNRGHSQFTRDPKAVRSASEIGDGIYSEINLSANSIRDVIRRLLEIFEIRREDLKIFLREDRDANDDS